MPAFEYEAFDPKGRKSKGLITADSELSARRELRGRALSPLSINRADNRASNHARTPSSSETFLEKLNRKHLSTRELMLITRQLASLIDAGITVAESVDLIGRQIEQHHMRRVLLSVRARVTEGERLSDAMSAFPHSFPPVYRALISAGESSGGLGEVMNKLADHLEKEQAVQSRVMGALIYPAVLSVVAIGVISLLMIFVVPRIADQFTGMGLSLPPLTRGMIAISEFLQASWPYLAGGLVLAGISFGFAMKREAVKRLIDAAMARMPLLGNFLRKVETARFARTMGILIFSGAVLPDALRASSRATDNLAFRDHIRSVVKNVETGQGLSDALKACNWFPSLMLYMVTAGERSGRMGEMFNRSADQLEQDIDGSITVGLNLLEPGIILALGGVVILIVLSILLPILQLNSMALG